MIVDSSSRPPKLRRFHGVTIELVRSSFPGGSIRKSDRTWMFNLNVYSLILASSTTGSQFALCEHSICPHKLREEPHHLSHQGNYLELWLHLPHRRKWGLDDSSGSDGGFQKSLSWASFVGNIWSPMRRLVSLRLVWVSSLIYRPRGIIYGHLVSLAR